MRKGLKSKILVLLVCLAALFAFAGCSLGITLDEIKEKNNLQAQVTYYAGEGSFEDKKNTKVIYYQNDTPVVDVSKQSGMTVERTEFEFIGWYYVVMDESGETPTPQWENEAEKIPLVGNEQVDFSKKIQSGEHLHIAAKWQGKEKLNILLACDSEAEIKANGVTYKNGDTLKSIPYEKGSDKAEQPSDVIDENGRYQFVLYYEDAECRTPIDFEIEKTKGEALGHTIYAKFISSEWIIIRDKEGVKDLFEEPTQGKKYYLARDINASTTVKPMASLACEIEGNGYTISNLKVSNGTKPQDQIGGNIGSSTTVAMLGKITATAKIRNLTFENVKITYALSALASSMSTHLYFVCESVESGAQIENVAFTGEDSQMTIKRNNSVVSDAAIFGEGVSETLFTVDLPENWKNVE